MTNAQNDLFWNLEFWSLEFIWYLVLGDWCFPIELYSFKDHVFCGLNLLFQIGNREGADRQIGI